MPKVSFRMASASHEWVFGVQTNTARKIHRSDHTEGRLTTAPSGCCVRKGTVTGTRRASSTAAEPPRAHGLIVKGFQPEAYRGLPVSNRISRDEVTDAMGGSLKGMQGTAMLAEELPSVAMQQRSTAIGALRPCPFSLERTCARRDRPHTLPIERHRSGRALEPRWSALLRVSQPSSSTYVDPSACACRLAAEYMNRSVELLLIMRAYRLHLAIHFARRS